MTTLRKHDSEMAVSIVVGLLLAFTILTIAAAQYQLNVVPQEELETESKHNNLVAEQFSEIRGNVIGTASSGERRSSTLKLGTSYKDVLIFGLFPTIHPDDPSGFFRTTSPSNNQIKIINATNKQEADNYWNGVGRPCDTTPQCYPTNFIVYTAEYQQYQNAPTRVYENTVVYDEYNSGEIVFRSNQSIVNGRNINLYALQGNISVGGQSSINVETRPVSAPAESITIQSNTTSADHPVKIVMPTRLNESHWERLLSDERASKPNGYIKKISVSDNQLRLTFEADEIYNLRLASVQVSTSADESPLRRTQAAYVAWKGTNQINIREGARQTISAQVRDKYNNGVSGIEVQATANYSNGECAGTFVNARSSGGDCGMPASLVSGNNGEVDFVYEAPDVSEDRDITISISIAPGEPTINSIPFTPSTETRLLSRETKASDLEGPVNEGNLNNRSTLRVLDFRFEKNEINWGSPVTAMVVVDNTHYRNISGVNITPSGNFFRLENPTSESTTISPNKRQRHRFKFRFFRYGERRVTIGDAAANITVVPPSTALIEADIQNRDSPREITDVAPSVFKDGHPPKTEDKESQNIPPVKYNEDGVIVNSAQGDLTNFPSMLSNNSESAVISPLASFNPRIGIATDTVPVNNHYELYVRYQVTSSDLQQFEMRIVTPDGQEIDRNTTYLLGRESGETVHRHFVLSQEESALIRQQNDLFVVLTNFTNDANPRTELRYQQVKARPLIPNRTSPEISVTDISIDESEPVEVGEPFTVNITLENTGSNGVIYDMKLRQTGVDSVNQIVSRKHFIVNPQTTRTVTVEHYVYSPGDYTLRVGNKTEEVSATS